MNKTAIKNFAVWARRKLISEITYKAGLYGITEAGIAQVSEPAKGIQVIPLGKAGQKEITGNEIAQRSAFVSAIQHKAPETDYKTAFQNVVEEVAYTWFNRMIAIRFMEVNDYLPSRIRVLSSENPAKAEPDFVTTPFDTDLEFTPYEKDRVHQLKDENKLDELFRLLFIKQCNKLHEILPELFEKTDDYTELLLTISFTDKDGVVWHLVHDIDEKDFNISTIGEDRKPTGQVEIIGWMYQYYNTEPKDEVFALLKQNVKITKERIPAATQLFTPDWIVRYMVENSLGTLWIEHCQAESGLDPTYMNGSYFGWKYYLEEAEQEPEVQAQLEKIRAEYKTIKPEDIKFIDPCMGSGHILVYAFDVLMQIYEVQGYTQRDAARLIVERNLYGLDIDRRAYQLAYFAVMMKARQYNRRILNGELETNLYIIQESTPITKDTIDYIANGDGKLRSAMQSIKDDLTDATEYGSILDVASVDFAALYARFDEIKDAFCEDLMSQLNQNICMTVILPLVKQAQSMAQKYDVVVTNPPYMGGAGMSGKMSDYVKAQYPDSKSDLFAVFMERCGEFTKKNGYQAMITQHAWMFLSSYEKLRLKLLHTFDFTNMAHLGIGTFEDLNSKVVQSVAFVIRNSRVSNYVANYHRLFEKQGIFEDNTQKAEWLISSKHRFDIPQAKFSKIPSSPIAYWVSDKFINAFDNCKICDLGVTTNGFTTGDNNRFLRLWFEVAREEIFYGATSIQSAEKSCKRWFPYNKGGAYRKWYGNNEFVINWYRDGIDVKAYGHLVPRSMNYQFKKSISWSKITTASSSFKVKATGTMFDVAGLSLFVSNERYFNYLLGLCNSRYAQNCLDVLSPTMNYETGHISSIPVIIDESKTSIVDKLVCENVTISKEDWDSIETSWDFKAHPLVERCCGIDTPDGHEIACISDAYTEWEYNCEQRFKQLQAHEEELNRIFIDIYGLQDELSPEVEDKDVTVRKADLGRDIRSFISYAVGCMLGRFSLDVDGLVYAGGEWDRSKYSTFIPDADNCIPIADEEYFEDDIVGRLVEIVRTVYGVDTLEENLDFIAKALGNKGGSSRDVIRSYFLNDFFKDHCSTYSATGSGKRPIYWLFDSGKQNGFKALVYMHRWNADTAGNVRVEYLHKMQKVYESEIARMQETIENSANSREVAAAQKRKDKLVKQLKEAKDYDAKIAHLALSRIDIDLDDGVKVNYEKVQTGQDGKMIEILAKI